VHSARKSTLSCALRTGKMRQEMPSSKRSARSWSVILAKGLANLHDRAAFINTILDGRSFNWTLMS